MPYSNVPEDMQDKMDSCVEKVMEKEGVDKESAIAMCYTSLMGGKSATTTPAPEGGEATTTDEVKVGARNSSADAKRIQAMHDYAVELGAACDMGKALMKSIDPAQVFVNFGDEIKVLGDVENGVKVGGKLVRYGSPTDVDLSEGRDFFTAETNFGLKPGERKHVPVYFNHTMPLPLDPEAKRMLIIDDEIGEAEIWQDDEGVMIEAILFNRAQYEKAIAGQIKSTGWSSGALGHTVQREAQKNGSHWVKRWIIGEGSVTPTPAEYRNAVIPLKSLSDNRTVEEGDPTASAAQDKSVTASAPEQTTPTIGVKKMEITQEVLEQMLEKAAESGAAKAIEATEPPVKSAGGIQITRDEAEQPFESAGDYFMAVKNAALSPHAIDKRLLPFKAGTGLNESDPSEGGFLVAPTIASGIHEKMHKVGSLLSLVAKDPVGPNSNGMTYNFIDETSRADGSRYGGIRGYWLAEGGTKTASQPAFRQLNLKLKKVAALCYATDELLADATALQSWLQRTVPEELRFKVEDAVYEGDGVGKPLGILNSGAIVSPTRIDANEVDATDLSNMWARRFAGVDDYVWLVEQSVIPQLFTLTLGNVPLYMPAGIHGAPTATIFGRPVLEIEYAAALGTTGDIMLCAPSQYQLIEKGGIESASSIHVQFLTDETVFRFVYRVDGAPMWNTTLTAFKGSSVTRSPFVTLSTSS